MIGVNNAKIRKGRVKAVFGVSDQVRHKPGSTATEDGYTFAIVYFVTVINKLWVYKILLLMHVGPTY